MKTKHKTAQLAFRGTCNSFKPWTMERREIEATVIGSALALDPRASFVPQRRTAGNLLFLADRPEPSHFAIRFGKAGRVRDGSYLLSLSRFPPDRKVHFSSFLVLGAAARGRMP
jgi:hypothetical protein